MNSDITKIKTNCDELIREFNQLYIIDEEREAESYLTFCQRLLDEAINAFTRSSINSLINEEAILNACYLYVAKIQVLDAVSNNAENLCQKNQKLFDELTARAELDLYIAINAIGKERFFEALQFICIDLFHKIPLLREVKAVYGDSWPEASVDWIEGSTQEFTPEILPFVTQDKWGNKRVFFRDNQGDGKLMAWFGYSKPSISHLLKN